MPILIQPNYQFPQNIVGGYFNNPVRIGQIPHFNVFEATYHLDYLRYLYFLCIMGAEGEYPIEIPIEQIIAAFNNKDRKCIPSIRKILIGEAPPRNYLNYFYNINSPWNIINGNPGPGQAWTSAIKNTLFPGAIFATKTEFLIACAQSGFLLLDLFPYAIEFKERNTNIYNTACINAFSGAYPYNIIAQLNSIICCLCNTLSIGFAMRSFGEIILDSAFCVHSSNHWLNANRRILHPAGPINLVRPVPLIGASNYLRICYQGGRNGGGPMGPNSILMHNGGINNLW